MDDQTAHLVLRRARELAGVDLRTAARQLGLSPRALRRYEAGTDPIPSDLVRRTIAAFGADDLIIPERSELLAGEQTELRVGGDLIPVSLSRHDNVSLLREYVHAVRRQRGLAKDAPVEFRSVDIAALAGVLDLTDDELESELIALAGVSRPAARRAAQSLVLAGLAILLTSGVLLGGSKEKARGESAAPLPKAAVSPVAAEVLGVSVEAPEGGVADVDPTSGGESAQAGDGQDMGSSRSVRNVSPASPSPIGGSTGLLPPDEAVAEIHTALVQDAGGPERVRTGADEGTPATDSAPAPEGGESAPPDSPDGGSASTEEPIQAPDVETDGGELIAEEKPDGGDTSEVAEGGAVTPDGETAGEAAETEQEAREKARADREAKAKERAEAREKARADREAKAKERAEARQKAKAEQEAREQERAEAREKARADREAKVKEKADQEAKDKADREARDKAEQEAKDKADREARDKAEQEAKDKADREAKEKAEQEAKARADQEAKARADREAKEKAAQEAREEANRETKQKADKDAKDKADREAKEKADRETKEKADREAKEKADREAKERADQEAKARADQEAKARADQEAKARADQKAKARADEEAKDKADREAKERADREARERADQEAKARADQEAKAKADKEAKEKAAQEAKGKGPKAPAST